jgi:hypothetical protein
MYNNSGKSIRVSAAILFSGKISSDNFVGIYLTRHGTCCFKNSVVPLCCISFLGSRLIVRQTSTKIKAIILPDYQTIADTGFFLTAL